MQNKMTEHTYINIMKESLDKKLRVLDDIIEANREQEMILWADETDYEKLDKTIEKKGACIDEIKGLDKGFQSLYDRVKQELSGNKELFEDDIREMQDKIRLITEKTMDIQAQEARNKEAFQGKVHYSKKEIKTAKTANKVAASYYQNMNKLNVVDSQFLDTKK